MRIVIIDPEGDLGVLFGDVLSAAGHDVVRISQQAEIVEQIVSVTPGVVLLASALAQADGSELIAQLRAQGCQSEINFIAEREWQDGHHNQESSVMISCSVTVH